MIDQYIQQYGRRLYGLCRSLCSNPYDADDLYQETWLRVVKHISQYDPSREFEPWLTRICVNTYRSTLRRLAKSPLLDFSNGDEKDWLLTSIPAPEEKDYSPLYSSNTDGCWIWGCGWRWYCSTSRERIWPPPPEF